MVKSAADLMRRWAAQGLMMTLPFGRPPPSPVRPRPFRVGIARLHVEDRDGLLKITSGAPIANTLRRGRRDSRWGGRNDRKARAGSGAWDSRRREAEQCLHSLIWEPNGHEDSGTYVYLVKVPSPIQPFWPDRVSLRSTGNGQWCSSPPANSSRFSCPLQKPNRQTDHVHPRCRRSVGSRRPHC